MKVEDDSGMKCYRNADVVIIGSGFGGLAAAIEAFDLNRDILIIEQAPSPGGNSLIAGGGINAVDAGRQSFQGIRDSEELHFKHTFEGGKRLGNPIQIEYLVQHSLDDCIHWLEEMGVEFPNEVIWGFGAQWPRTHFPASYRRFRCGAAIIHAMLDRVNENESQILYNCKMERIIRERHLEGKVIGIEVRLGGETKYIRANNGVILATGGFAANTRIIGAHDQRLTHLDTTNRPGAGTGHGLLAAQDIGADVVHLDYIQAVPKRVQPPFKATFSSVTDGLHEAEHLLSYQVFVNKEGKRFVNEDALRNEVTLAGLQQREFDPIPAVSESSFEELGKKIGVPIKPFLNTIRNYNLYCKIKDDKLFGKHALCLNPLEIPPFSASAYALARHYTMGGVRVNPYTNEVLDRRGNPIPRLCGAGEVIGGLHGADRLGHNATPACILSGRLAAKTVCAKTEREW